MKLASLLRVVAVACTSFVNAGSITSDKCITKPEAAAFLKDYNKIWGRASGWEDIALKVVAPNYVLKSGSIASARGQVVGDVYPVIFSSRAELIAFLADPKNASPGPSTTLQSDVVGCDSLIWQSKEKRRDADGYIMQFHRFDLRHVQGKWKLYSSEIEYDSLAAVDFVVQYRGTSALIKW